MAGCELYSFGEPSIHSRKLKMQPHVITKCRLCGSPHLENVLDLGIQKLTGVFPRSVDELVLEGPLELVRCVPDGEACGLLQLRHSYPQEAMYGENYGYRSGLNASMVAHLESKTKKLLSLANPPAGSLLVDIGSNDGTLLKSYPAYYQKAGIDPVAKKFLSFYTKDIQVVADFFSSQVWEAHFGSQKAAIITSVAMFYDLEAPLEFVQNIAERLTPDGLWHFEQSYMPFMLKNLAYDTICHEHIEYYALRQIHWALQRCGMKIVDLEPSQVNGGSLAVTATLANSRIPEAIGPLESLLAAERAAGLDSMNPFFVFQKDVFRHRGQLKETMAGLHKKGLRVLGYGASTKGNVLLQFCNFDVRDIPLIGEVNPDKYGSFTPGTKIPIVSEQVMHAEKPDVLLVLPWHFRDSIIERERLYISKGGRLLFPLPRISFYPN